MTKRVFTQMAAPENLPSFPLLEDKRGEQTASHNRFVADLQNSFFVRAQEAIFNGAPVLRAWRQAYGDRKSDMAQVLQCNLKHYELLEAGAIPLTGEEALALSKHYGVMPYHMIHADGNPMPEDILRASLTAYDNIDPRDEALKQEAHMALTDEAIPFHSIEKLQEMRGNIHDPRGPYGQIATFIDMLLLEDRCPHTKLAEGYEATKDGFLLSLYDAQDTAKEEFEAANSTRKKTYDRFSRFGSKLYREIDDENVTWPNISSSLIRLSKVMSPRKLVAYYRDNPASIGLNHWPHVRKDDFFDDGVFVGSWKKAHTRHADIMESVFKSDVGYTEAMSRMSKLNVQVENFEKFAKGTVPTLGFFFNRQIVTAHPDFKHLRPVYIKGLKRIPTL